MHRLRVEADSPLCDKTVTEARVGDQWNTYVLAVRRQERLATHVIPMTPDMRLKAGDVILVDSEPSDVRRLLADCQLSELPMAPAHGKRLRETFGVAEILIPPESAYIGETIRSMELRSRYGVTALGMRRKGANLEGDRTSEPLKAGDILLVAGAWKQIEQVKSNPRNLILLTLPAEVKHAVPMSSHAPIAFAVLLAMVVLLVLETLPMLVTILLAALVLVATGCLTMDRAYQSVQWSTLVLVAGLLPVALALEKTGGMQLIAEGLLSSVEGIGPYGLLSVVFFLTAGLSMFLSNTATAVLVAPLAVRMALDLGYEPQAFAVMVVMGASAAYVTPISTPVVSLVVAPGNYRFTDFVKVGLPLLVVTWAVVLAVTPLFFHW
jgi:di/tricarboxylate transporter